MGESLSAVLSLFLCFCLSVCFFNKSLVLFLHSNLKRREAFSPVAFSLVLSPFYQESFHILNDYCLIAICKEWKVGALKEEEKRFSRAAVCFSDFSMACCLFWVEFFSLLYEQYWLIRRGVHKGFTKDWVWAEDVYLAIKFRSRVRFQGSGLA